MSHKNRKKSLKHHRRFSDIPLPMDGMGFVLIDELCDKGFISESQASQCALTLQEEKIDRLYHVQESNAPSLSGCEPFPTAQVLAGTCFDKYRFGLNFLVFSFEEWIVSKDKRQFSRIVYLKDRAIPGNPLKKTVFIVLFDEAGIVKDDYAIYHGQKLGFSAAR